MKSLLEFLPLAAFLIAYYLRDVYAATAVLMVTMPLMLLGLWLLTRQVGTMPLISTILVLVFGTLTLLLHDPRFIQWKATIFLWGVSLVLLANFRIGRKLIVAQFLEAVAEGRRVTQAQWRTLNWWWVGVYAVLGATNLLFAYCTPETVWANFKVFGLTAALLVFLVAQAVWLQRLPPAEPASPA